MRQKLRENFVGFVHFRNASVFILLKFFDGGGLGFMARSSPMTTPLGADNRLLLALWQYSLYEMSNDTCRS